jgi:hypothetical protein
MCLILFGIIVLGLIANKITKFQLQVAGTKALQSTTRVTGALANRVQSGKNFVSTANNSSRKLMALLTDRAEKTAVSLEKLNEALNEAVIRGNANAEQRVRRRALEVENNFTVSVRELAGGIQALVQVSTLLVGNNGGAKLLRAAAAGTDFVTQTAKGQITNLNKPSTAMKALGAAAAAGGIAMTGGATLGMGAAAALAGAGRALTAPNNTSRAPGNGLRLLQTGNNGVRARTQAPSFNNGRGLLLQGRNGPRTQRALMLQAPR